MKLIFIEQYTEEYRHLIDQFFDSTFGDSNYNISKIKSLQLTDYGIDDNIPKYISIILNKMKTSCNFCSLSLDDSLLSSQMLF